MLGRRSNLMIYLVTLMEAEGCNEDQYEVFDIKTNDGITEVTTGG